MKVFLSGEGPDDLGDYFHAPQYRSQPPAIGIVEALLRKVTGVEPAVLGACAWKRIRKFRFGHPIEAETRNVLGLMIEAGEVGADVLVFVRDQDGELEREEAVEKGIEIARKRGDGPAIVGGVAVQEIEAWILALLGERRSEDCSNAKAVLEEKHAIADRAAKVAVVEQAELGRVPDDARSLSTWVGRARRVIAAGGGIT